MVKYLHRGEEAILCLLLVSLTALGCIDAMFRLTGTVSLWMTDVLAWNAAWFVLLGASYGVRTGSHIGLTVLTDKIGNPTIKRFVSLIAVVICITYTLIFLYSSWQYVYTQYRIGFDMEDLPVKQWIPYAGLLIGFALLLIRFIVLAINILRGKTNGFSYADEAKESVEQLAQPQQKSEELV